MVRTGKRVALATSEGRTPAEELWRIGSIEGAQACGFEDERLQVRARASAPVKAVTPADGPKLVTPKLPEHHRKPVRHLRGELSDQAVLDPEMS